MDYGKMLEQHNHAGADVTLATIQIAPDETYRFGVVEVDRDHRVNGFLEKPKQTDLRSPWNPEKVAASMGIYLFNTDVLIPVLLKDAEDSNSSHDFGKDILPKMVDEYRVYAYDFVDENKKEALYWRDVGTLEAYYEANMDIVSVSRSSICMTPTGQSERISANIRLPSLSSPRRAARERRSIRLCRRAASCPAARLSNCILSPDVRVNSYSRDRQQHPVFTRKRGPALPHSASNY